TLPLPMDTPMQTLAGVSAQFGSSTGATMTTADMNAYWQQHHGTDWPAGITTRYAAYQLEQGIGGAAPAWQGEQNAPYCTPTTPVGPSTRRVISVAIVNCLANNVQGNTNTSLLGTQYADFFVTKPADSTIYLEFVRFLTPTTNGSQLHHVVQLDR